MKHCPKCNQDLDESLFKKKSNGSYQAYCIECKKMIDREYQARKRAEKLAVKIEPENEETETVSEEIETLLPETEPENVKDSQTVVYCPCDDWIPIEERLPERSGIYLITQLGSNTFEQASKNIKVPVVSEAYFQPGGFLNNNVQAWRPVPEPYKHVKPTIAPAPWYQRAPLGRKDRNDQEIREGDILSIRTVTAFDYSKESPVVVKWDPRSLAMSTSKIHEIGGDTLHGVQIRFFNQCEIIGSIYDKKSLENVIIEENFSSRYEYEKAISWLLGGEVVGGKNGSK